MARKAVGRKVGPKTSRDSAKKTQSVGKVDVYRCLKRIAPATCEEVIIELQRQLPPGKKLREDPISGMFNLLSLEGRIATTGKKGVNTSNHAAMLWRITTPEERHFINRYVGSDRKSPWPSPDTLLELPDVIDVLSKHENKKVRRMYRRYKMGRLFRSIMKDKGIKWFMRNYDEKGRKKEL
jgi:hypothetical protein